jgi:hypothetical protein
MLAGGGNADSSSMKRRVWMILAADLAAGAVFAGAVLAGSGPSSTVFQPTSASWGLFSPAQWKTVQARVVRRGFEPVGIRIVGGVTLLPQRQPLAFVAGTTGGRVCIVPVEGARLGPTTCSVDKPIVLFRPPGTTQGMLLGLVGHGVVGLSATDREGNVLGLPLVRVGAMLTFAADFPDAVSLRAYDADGDVLARIDFGA